MVSLAAIAIGAAVLGGSPLDTHDPAPLTDVQREMIDSGMFETDSFREPAFEALVENVRSWEPETYSNQRQPIIDWTPEVFTEVFERERGELCSFSGTVRMAEPLGDAFPGVTRLAVERVSRRPGDRLRTILVYLVDESPPEIGSKAYFFGRIYKVMRLQPLNSEALTPFPAIVARTYEYDDVYVDDSEDDVRFFQNMNDSFPAIITAFTGALAVIFFVVLMGRHMLGTNRPPRPPLASTTQTPDDAPDA